MEQFLDNIFLAEDRVNFYGASLQTRMAVIRLADGALLLYSPIMLTEDIRRQLADLGQVRYVISPNKIHNQALKSYESQYPGAKLYASPGLMARKPDIRFTGELTGDAEPEWQDDIEQVLTGGNVFFSEVIMFHKSSRTLLVGDFIENMNRTTSTKMFMFKLFGVKLKPMASPEFRLYTMDERQARASLEVVKRWDFERIFLCHGDMIEQNAKAVFEEVCREFLAGVSKKGWINKKISTLFAKFQ